MIKKSLVDIFSEIGHFGSDIGCNDKGGQHSYLETYDSLFEPYRNGATFLEIGLAVGDSIRLWDKYFYNSEIIGVDISLVFDVHSLPINPNCNSIELIEADATQKDFLEKIKGYKFSIVNDDGQHTEQAQMATFNLLKPQMANGSIYAIEDVLNIDASKERFMSLHDNCEIIDLRHVKNRFDDVIILYKF